MQKKKEEKKRRKGGKKREGKVKYLYVSEIFLHNTKGQDWWATGSFGVGTVVISKVGPLIGQIFKRTLINVFENACGRDQSSFCLPVNKGRLHQMDIIKVRSSQVYLENKHPNQSRFSLEFLMPSNSRNKWKNKTTNNRKLLSKRSFTS